MTDPSTNTESLSWPLPSFLPAELAAACLGELERGWALQCAGQPTNEAQTPRLTTDVEELFELEADLRTLRTWFDPTATGSRLRKELARLEPWQPVSFAQTNLVFQVGDNSWLVTPEGRAAIWCLRRAGKEASSADSWWLEPTDVNAATEALLGQYREWNHQRLGAVASLLMDETATLRPTAAGLLLVLLINRNTAPERAVPRPKSAEQQQAISSAMAAPALAYAHALVGRETAGEKGMSLFGGWALGELSRRLGGGIETEGRIYIQPGSVVRAEERLHADLRQRPEAMRSRVPFALQECLLAYENSRPFLNALGIAYERPADTTALVQRMTQAAMGVLRP